MQLITAGVSIRAAWAGLSCKSSSSWRKENSRLKKIVAELELEKLILKESLDYLKPPLF